MHEPEELLHNIQDSYRLWSLDMAAVAIFLRDVVKYGSSTDDRERFGFEDHQGGSSGAVHKR